MALDENEEEISFAALFQKMNVDMRIRKGIARMGIVRPTLVQAKCLDLAITKGRDLVCKAKTGSGKTLAYLIPIVQKILSQNKSDEKISGIKAVILVPTKELVAQVYNVLQDLTYYCSEVVSYQKVLNSDKQEAAMLRDEPSIVIATPAGLLKHVQSGVVVLKNSVESMCLDEADLILSFGYAKDVTELVKALPKICQGFLLSATLSPELNRLKRIVLNSPAILKLEDERVDKNGKLMQFYLSLPKKDKQLVLYVFLKLGLLKGKGLFFVNTTDAGYKVKLFLEQFHIRSAVLNAELPLQSRVSIIEGFNAGNFDYLIATDESMDVGKDSMSEDELSDEGEGSDVDTNAADDQYGVARGVDFRNVSFVVNFDFPPSPQSYTHRIGRTARAGAKGVALSLVDSASAEEAEMLENVQAYQPKLSVPLGSDRLAAATSPSGNGMFNSGHAQPSPLDFDLREIEGFRYRVEDVGRAVTKVAVRETRSAELRAEILNSERLKQHFEENPHDLQLLRHDRQATHISKVKSHLKNVPKYLLPRGMQVAELNKKRKRRRARNNASAVRRIDNDPLQSFEGSVNLDGVTEGDAFVDGDEPGPKVIPKQESKLIAYSSQAGESSSGRKAWQMRHKKGKWGNSSRKRGKNERS